MGPATHKWPVSLAEFTAGHHDEIDQAIQGQSDRPETYAGPRIISGVAEANLEVMGLPHMGVVSGRPEGNYARPGGRPRKWKSEAERKRAERERQRSMRFNDDIRRKNPGRRLEPCFEADTGRKASRDARALPAQDVAAKGSRAKARPGRADGVEAGRN
jgi:hypothetical protein